MYHERGFQVSFHEIGQEYTESEYQALTEYLQDITGASPEIGVFHGGVPHVSFCVQTEEMAQMICRMFGQVAYWDWTSRKARRV